MNKRIKKKRELESKLRTLDMTVDFLLDQNNQLWKIVDKMEEINSRNTEATNKRFDQVEADVSTLKKAKKPWFGRK
ncbi:TPA: hypothetical protein VIO54_001185 [Streptococcus pyogenes]|uniref:Uncharacterized protein n=2 Tax=Streptococcus TaxID=1301 RepID=A0A9X8T318_STREQ|nr:MULTISPECIES: hypothetical protein [Streptococcus]HEQ9463612.1 hypothetical protein [Streptococcus pyogenes]WOT14457.1 hypothetical protein F6I35_0001480 [Streptococcus anginosus]SUN62208.1 Uncharacterised protein [Streptococcus dysgalactiae subsp. equisimilis]VTS20575.1 Uncharacterised protein [Streptococcus anginosus]HEQ9486044.1 hypothetical protein [Streptococcus pyogenes]